MKELIFTTEKNRKAQVQKALDAVFPGKPFYLSCGGKYVEVVWFFEDGVSRMEMEIFQFLFNDFIPKEQISLTLSGISRATRNQA